MYVYCMYSRIYCNWFVISSMYHKRKNCYLLCTETPYGLDAQALSLVGGGVVRVLCAAHMATLNSHLSRVASIREAFLKDGKSGNTFPNNRF